MLNWPVSMLAGSAASADSQYGMVDAFEQDNTKAVEFKQEDLDNEINELNNASLPVLMLQSN